MNKNIAKRIVYFGTFVFITAIFCFYIYSIKAVGPVNVYYSVGQSSTTNMMLGLPTITINSGTATFSIAQTGNIGVGDKITYNTNSVAYISGKSSTTVWSVITATGGTPDNVTGQTVNSIKRAFASLSEAETASANSDHLNTSDLTSGGGYILNLPCYNDTLSVASVDTTAVVIDGWTTSADNYIKVYTPQGGLESNNSQRHNGKWDETKYRLEITNPLVIIDIVEDFVRIEGLQIKLTANTAGHNVLFIENPGANSQIYISNNIFRGVLSGTADSIYGIIVAFQGENGILKLWNNIFYDFHNQGYTSNMAIRSGYYGSIGTTYAYNNTVHNSYRGFRNVSGTFIAKNNIAQNCNDGYSGTFISSNYNISDVAGDTTGGDHDKGTTTVMFVDEDNDDFHLLSSDTAAKDSGTDLSADANLSFSKDIDNQTRSVSWDIGADETTAPTLTEVTAIANPISSSTPNYTFSTDKTGTIVVSGGCTSSSTSAVFGNNTISFNNLSDDTYDGCIITLTDLAGLVGILNVSAFEVDTTAPVIISHTPSGSSTSTSQTLIITTNEVAECRYSATSTNVSFSSMTSTFDSTNSTSHSKAFTDLFIGTHLYFVRCSDLLGNVNTSNYIASFAAISTTGKKNLFVIGDSIEGSYDGYWPRALADPPSDFIFTPYNLADLSYAAQSVADTSWNQDICINGVGYDCIKNQINADFLITISTNDIIAMYAKYDNNIDAIITAYRVFFDRIRSDHPNSHIIFASRYPFHTGTGAWQAGSFNQGEQSCEGGMSCVNFLNTNYQVFIERMTDLTIEKEVIYLNLWQNIIDDYGINNTDNFADAYLADPIHLDNEGKPGGDNYYNYYLRPHLEAESPYNSTLGINNIDITGNIKIYFNGKFRYTTATSSTPTANFNVAPVNGYSASTSQYMDITINNWDTTGASDYYKKWTATSSIATTTIYTINDLAPSTYYNLKLDSTASTTAFSGDTCESGVCQSDGSGQIVFTYSGGYSTHTFEVEEGDNTAPSLSSGSPSGTVTSLTQTLSLSTDETATCKYSTTANTAYASMANLTNTNSTSHSMDLSGLTNNTNYTYYIRCQDNVGNYNTSDYTISFTISGNGAVPVFLIPQVNIPLSQPENKNNNSNNQNTQTNNNTQNNSNQTNKNSGQINNNQINNNQNIKNNLPNKIKYIFKRYLILGSLGTEVRELQKRLNELGLFKNKPTGYFGTLTRKAVKLFQKLNKIEQTGTVGPKTRGVLNK